MTGCDSVRNPRRKSAISSYPTTDIHQVDLPACRATCGSRRTRGVLKDRVQIVDEVDCGCVFIVIRKRRNYGHIPRYQVIVRVSPCLIRRFDQKLVFPFLDNWTCIVICRRLKYGRISCFGFPEYCIRCIMFICQGFVSTTVLLKT
jgi:hypothetical protein